MTNQEQLIALGRRLRQAMVEQDTATLEDLLVEDALVRDRIGYNQSKEAWIDSIRLAQITYIHMFEESIAVELSEDTAKVYMRNRVEGQFFTMRDIWDLQIVMNAVKIGDDWKVERLLFRPFNDAYDYEAKTSPDETELLALSRQIRQAMVDQDVAVIDRIFADGATLTHQTGYQQPKEEWIESMQNGKMRYFTATEVSIEAKVDGDKGRVVMRNNVDALIFGSRHVWNLQLTFYFEKQAGEWRIVRSVARPFSVD